MALLLAALMVVAAFAGCAGVKQDDLDAVNDRVDALEDAINGVGDKIDALPGSDNQAILDAIESVKNDLNEKIESVNDRVNEVEKDPAVSGTASDAVKAKQSEALASIETQKAVFAKNAAEYDDDTYAAITAAFGTAQAAINAATTEAAVKAAMDKLTAELDTYKSYAMKLYDYYVALLGNINDDAEALVDEASDYLEVVLEAYKTAANAITETKYLVSEGTTEAKNVYLDVYSSVKALCDIYNKKVANAGTVEYVNAKGKVVSASFDSLKTMKDTAKQLVKDIEKDLGEEIKYKDIATLTAGNPNKIEALQIRYEAFVEAAEIVFGEKVATLVTNANVLVEAEDAIEALLQAKDAFAALNGRGKDGLYYYDEITAKHGNVAVALTIKDPAKATNPDTIWADDYYTDNIDDVIAEWIADYALSDENAEAIINAVLAARTAGYKYEDYLLTRRHVALIAEAYEKFESEIVPAIEDLNGISAGSAEAVAEFKAIKDAIEDLYVLQAANKKSENAIDKKELTLSNAVFTQFLAASEVLNVNGLDTKILSAATVTETQVDNLNTTRINNFITNFGSVKEVKNLENLFTFASDVKDIERAGDNYITLAGAGEWNNTAKAEIYNFFANEYKTAEAAAKKINTAIEYLAKQVKDAKLDSNALFVDLEGVYIDATNASLEAADTRTAWTYTSTDKKLTLNASSAGYYVAIADVLDYEDATAPITVVVNGVTVMTIDYFNYKYPVFEELIDTDAFEAAYETLNDRLDTLFAQIDELGEMVEEIEYVRTANAYEYVDANSNGKYDIGEAKGDDNKDGVMNAGEAWVKINSVVSLNDQAAVKAASDLYDAWVLAGGSHNIVAFAEKVNPDTEKAYGGVYYMEGFANATEVTATINTLKDLENKIQTLVDAANAFVNGVKLVGDVNAFNKFVVTENDNRLDGSTNEYNRYAVTGFVQSTANNNVANRHGSWTYVYKNGTKLATSTQALVVPTSGTDTTAAAFLASKNALTKKDLLKEVANLYEAFYAANVEFVAAENNDYDDTNRDFYEAQGYVAYKAVDDALTTYAAYELLSAKAAAIAQITATDDKAKTTKRQILETAKTVENIEQILANYKTVDNTFSLTLSNITDYTIYDFAKLGTAAPAVTVVYGDQKAEADVRYDNELDEVNVVVDYDGEKNVAISYTLPENFTAFDNLIMNANKACVGIIFEKADADAKQVVVTINGVAGTAIDLTVDSAVVLNGEFIEYFYFANADGSEINATHTLEFDWQKADGTSLTKTEITVVVNG